MSVRPPSMNISFMKIILVFSLPNVEKVFSGGRFPVSRSSIPRLRDRVLFRKLPRKPLIEARRRQNQHAKKIFNKSLDKFEKLGGIPSVKSSKYGGQDKIQDKQLFLPSPRPRFPIRLNPAAFLIPAIPTALG